VNDEPRDPGDEHPDEPGWWVAGKWYPSETGPARPRPATRARPAWSARPSPLWFRIALPVLIVALVAGIATAMARSSGSHHKPGPASVTTTSLALSAETSTQPQRAAPTGK
jgi:hypothetical protein